MINFLQETINKLQENGKSTNDVKWIGYRDSSKVCTWKTFVSLANFQYDNDFGIEHINLNLVVVGDGWWLERHEYDGSEWWAFKTQPITKMGFELIDSQDDLKTGY